MLEKLNNKHTETKKTKKDLLMQSNHEELLKNLYNIQEKKKNFDEKIDKFYQEFLLGDEKRLHLTVSQIIHATDNPIEKQLLKTLAIDTKKPLSEASPIAQALTFRVFQKELNPDQLRIDLKLYDKNTDEYKFFVTYNKLLDSLIYPSYDPAIHGLPHINVVLKKDIHEYLKETDGVLDLTETFVVDGDNYYPENLPEGMIDSNIRALGILSYEGKTMKGIEDITNLEALYIGIQGNSGTLSIGEEFESLKKIKRLNIEDNSKLQSPRKIFNVKISPKFLEVNNFEEISIQGLDCESKTLENLHVENLLLSKLHTDSLQKIIENMYKAKYIKNCVLKNTQEARGHKEITIPASIRKTPGLQELVVESKTKKYDGEISTGEKNEFCAVIEGDYAGENLEKCELNFNEIKYIK